MLKNRDAGGVKTTQPLANSSEPAGKVLDVGASLVFAGDINVISSLQSR